MTPADFRRIALSLPNTEESSHMGAADFRVAGRIFATLASVKEGFGNLMLDPEQQALFLAEADEPTLTGALRAAYNLRIQKNAATKKPSPRNPK